MFMVSEQDIGSVARVIQLAMAPAFLLVATGTLLQLFSLRLARVVDRERMLIDAFHRTKGAEHDDVVQELRDLDKRAGVVNFAILMGVLSAITVGLVIALLFMLANFGVGMIHLVTGGFILAMLFLIAGLGSFLYEVRLASRNIHVQEQLLELENANPRRGFSLRAKR